MGGRSAPPLRPPRGRSLSSRGGFSAARAAMTRCARDTLRAFLRRVVRLNRFVPLSCTPYVEVITLFHAARSLVRDASEESFDMVHSTNH